MDDAKALHDPDLPAAERVESAVEQMTLEEKISQMCYDAPAVERLGIPAYNWWNECLHGVGRAGIATVFPQAIGLAASFDPQLVYRVASAISEEARAKHHESARQGDRGIYKGLTFWSPNVNIFRDPRWGRGQETYGEDPYLTGRLGVAFVRGLQGDDPERLKLVATPKHFAVHSGPEGLRHHFDARVTPKDLYETYLPAFRECVREGRAASVMGAYNRTNGEPCCASPTLLGQILREQWGFTGYVVSDCGAIRDIYATHTCASTPEQAAALAVNAGCDLNCGRTYTALVGAAEQGLVSRETIDRAVTRLLEARVRLGMFDPPERAAYASTPYERNDCPEYRRLAREAAQASMVLLKNSAGLLPLSPELRSIAVVGPNADDRDVLLGNYNGLPSSSTTVLEGIRRAVSPGTRVIYARGCDWIGTTSVWGYDEDRGFAEAVSAAERAEVVVLCLGITASLEGEEGSASRSEWQGDRRGIGLPEVQQHLLERVVAAGKPTVLVLMSGSPLAVGWADEHVEAILEAWYPGEEGGAAVADVLFGAADPAGRLPVTFVRSLDQLPPFTDYEMRGRTYRYLESEPLYPFGYGLSYTSFEYSSCSLSSATADIGALPGELAATVRVRNAGDRPGDEVVQLYLANRNADCTVPRHRLAGVRRVRLEAGEESEVRFELSEALLAYVDLEGRSVLAPGEIHLSVGGRQPDSRSEALLRREGKAAEVRRAVLTLRGRRRIVEA